MSGGTFPEFEGQADNYDIIAMNNYLEHTVEPRLELEKSMSLLSSGSYLIGEVPGFDSWERRLFGRYWGGNHVPRHTYQFNSDFLAQLLRDTGFVDVEMSKICGRTRRYVLAEAATMRFCCCFLFP